MPIKKEASEIWATEEYDAIEKFVETRDSMNSKIINRGKNLLNADVFKDIASQEEIEFLEGEIKKAEALIK